jgi:hypothetical protein
MLLLRDNHLLRPVGGSASRHVHEVRRLLRRTCVPLPHRRSFRVCYRYFYPPTFRNDKVFVPVPNVVVPVGRFSVNVRFLHDFQLRIPYVVRKPGSNGPISAAAFCPVTGRGGNSEFLHEPAGTEPIHRDNPVAVPRPHAVVEFSSDTKDLLDQLGIPGISGGATESKSMEPGVFGGSVSMPLAAPPPAVESSSLEQPFAEDTFTPVPQSNRDTNSGTVESLAEMLSTNALMNAGPVGFATAQACECGWLTVDVKVCCLCGLSASVFERSIGELSLLV